MKRIRIETGSDVRRWDTYELDVPDDFDGDTDAGQQYLRDRLGANSGITLVDTSYENEYEKYPPEKADINTWTVI
ncbi:hypothetical protein [Nocardia thailandica]|uniref:hypothetical protein n=1 Tax=Nocardia thailandica TaxID=257275 RepID=UPI0002ECA978|nr:hypothetical protein [Nocardia thailandica]